MLVIKTSKAYHVAYKLKESGCTGSPDLVYIYKENSCAKYFTDAVVETIVVRDPKTCPFVLLHLGKIE